MHLTYILPYYSITYFICLLTGRLRSTILRSVLMTPRPPPLCFTQLFSSIIYAVIMYWRPRKSLSIKTRFFLYAAKRISVKQIGHYACSVLNLPLCFHPKARLVKTLSCTHAFLGQHYRFCCQSALARFPRQHRFPVVLLWSYRDPVTHKIIYFEAVCESVTLVKKCK